MDVKNEGDPIVTQSPMAVRDLARTMAVPQMLRLVLALLEENAPFEDAELRLCHGLTTTVATWFGAKVAGLVPQPTALPRSTCPACGSPNQYARGPSRVPDVTGGEGLCSHAWHTDARDQGGDQ